MKTIEELNALKEEFKTLNRKLTGLKEEKLSQVTGGTDSHSEIWFCKYCPGPTLQTWIGIGEDWDRDGNKHRCDLWLCEKCNCTNYRDINTGRLL